MIREKSNCIDCGTEYCPCKLAESGECIICSQLQGKCFCDCLNWKGVCIYQELYNNKGKAKEGRQTYSLKVIDVNEVDKDVVIIKFIAPHKLAIDLAKPGSYIFVRTDENNYFDIPISILESDIDKNIIAILVEIKGIKTKKLKEIKLNADIVLRGPYWNGVFGLDDLQKQKENNVLVLARGIGIAPMMPVIRKLVQNNNKIELFIDKASYKDIIVEEYLKKYEIVPNEVSLLANGKLTDEAKYIVKKVIEEKDIKFVHVAGADILTSNVIEYLDYIGKNKMPMSCCNNFKMCCGEGICGACTVRYSGHRVRRYCKFQTDPRSIQEGRRYI